MRTPEAERVVNPQCFPKDKARKTTWKFLSVETDCFKFIFLIFGGCQSLMLPSLWFIFVLLLCKLTGSSLVHSNTSQEQGLAAVAARRQFPSPQHTPRYQQLSVKQSHGSSLHLRFCLLDFQLGNMCIFPRLHFGRLATGLRPVLPSFTFLCYPRATFVWRFPSICRIFLHFASALPGKVIPSQ